MRSPAKSCAAPARSLLGALIVCLFAEAALAAGPYVLVTGRRDPRVVVIDLERALDPANNGTSNAVVSRVRVTPDVDTDGDGIADSPASGLPSNVVVSADGRTAYVVNHGGNATAAQTNSFQHGHLGTVTVLDVRRAIDPANNNTTHAIDAIIPTGFWGPVGLGLTRDGRHALVASSEGDGKEDGAREISVIDLRARAHTQTVLLAYGDGGEVREPVVKSCAELIADPALRAKALPDPSFGCFPASNALGIARHTGYAFTANGGTNDVSVVNVRQAIRGGRHPEVARIPVESGAWGLAVDAKETLVAVTNRENAESGAEGNTISIIDVHRAIRDHRKKAEVARVRVGTDDPGVATRPFGIAFTPDGKYILVPNFRSNNVSIVDVKRALAGGLAGGPGAEVARIALAKPGGGAARPRGVAVTADGRYAVVSGGAQFTAAPNGGYGEFCENVAPIDSCGALWVIDLNTRAVVATVTGVGNEPYLADIAPSPEK